MSIQEVLSEAIIDSPCWRYDVFLSFRGDDTRNNFTDHLYAALKQKGIIVFRDDHELERGKSISPELFKAIEESKFSIVIFSKNYAYSTWCLEELVKIVECKNKSTHQQIVFPIFYDVEPTIVRKQTDTFQQAFAKHEKTLAENIEKVQKWRDTLKEVANISGWELKDRSESKIIDDIVMKILTNSSKFNIHKELVGLNSRLEELMLLLDTGSGGVRMIGICGMGGLGKTTIARVAYDLASCEFEGHSFLANVREISKKYGLISLQKLLLSDILKLIDCNIWNVYEGIHMIGSRLRQKKVFLVIDDVENREQLEGLAATCDWFGSGSRIIITSRDEHLMRSHGVDEVYKLKELNQDEAFQLFCVKAFRAHQPMQAYDQLCEQVLEYAAGLPLALTVLGSFLCGRTLKEWKSALQRLKKDSTNPIMQILKISFDGLQETEKKIFLDISCFFTEKDIDYVTTIMDGCEFDPGIGIPVLIEKSLISISNNNKVWMHDLLKEMGQHIVRRESDEPRKCTRLWEESIVRHMLSENTGTKEIEAIMLNYWNNMAYSSADAKCFWKMTKLRLLKIHNVELPRGLEYLSNELRLLEWHGYPLESLPSNLQLQKIVELTMCYSNIKQLWSTTKPLNNLKVMRFSHSRNLIRTPDLTGVQNLKELILDGCLKLLEIHPSLLVHQKIILLNLKGCTNLTTLSDKIAMESLQKLLLSGCSKLRKFPEIEGRMKSLSELHLDGTAVKELPSSIELLSGLAFLDLNDCKNLVRLPSTINGLKSLKTLKLSGCSKLRKFPEITRGMESLSELYLGGTAIEELPLSIELLSGLAFLDLNDCKNVVRLPNTIKGLRSLKILKLSGCMKLNNGPENLGKVESLEELDISGTAIRKPVSSIFLLKNLKVLSFRGCKGPPESSSWFSSLPINWMPRRSSDLVSLVLPSLSSLSSLAKLDLSDCNLGEGAIPIGICKLLSLKELNLSKNNFVSLPGTINRLSKLEVLMLEDCKRLESVLELPSNVKKVIMNGCASLERVSDAFKPRNSYFLIFHYVNCMKLLGNNNLAPSMLEGFLKVESNLKADFHTVVPGSRIPEWFKYQNEGSTITIISPPDSCYKNKSKNKLVGHAICCVFHVHKHPPTVRRMFSNHTHVLKCYMEANKIESFRFYSMAFAYELGQSLSDHLWLFYLSNESSKLQEGFSNFDWNFECNHVELSFRPQCKSCPGFEVKRCGVHPIYVAEVEELNKTTKEWRRSKIWNINESHQLFVESTMDVPITSKRGLPEYFKAEASASDEEPQSKRLKQLDQ